MKYDDTTREWHSYSEVCEYFLPLSSSITLNLSLSIMRLSYSHQIPRLRLMQRLLSSTKHLIQADLLKTVGRTREETEQFNMCRWERPYSSSKGVQDLVRVHLYFLRLYPILLVKVWREELFRFLNHVSEWVLWKMQGLRSTTYR